MSECQSWKFIFYLFTSGRCFHVDARRLKTRKALRKILKDGTEIWLMMVKTFFFILQLIWVYKESYLILNFNEFSRLHPLPKVVMAMKTKLKVWRKVFWGRNLISWQICSPPLPNKVSLNSREINDIILMTLTSRFGTR